MRESPCERSAQGPGIVSGVLVSTGQAGSIGVNKQGGGLAREFTYHVGDHSSRANDHAYHSRGTAVLYVKRRLRADILFDAQQCRPQISCGASGKQAR